MKFCLVGKSLVVALTLVLVKLKLKGKLIALYNFFKVVAKLFLDTDNTEGSH